MPRRNARNTTFEAETGNAAINECVGTSHVRSDSAEANQSVYEPAYMTVPVTLRLEDIQITNPSRQGEEHSPASLCVHSGEWLGIGTCVTHMLPWGACRGQSALASTSATSRGEEQTAAARPPAAGRPFYAGPPATSYPAYSPDIRTRGGRRNRPEVAPPPQFPPSPSTAAILDNQIDQAAQRDMPDGLATSTAGLASWLPVDPGSTGSGGMRWYQVASFNDSPRSSDAPTAELTALRQAHTELGNRNAGLHELLVRERRASQTVAEYLASSTSVPDAMTALTLIARCAVLLEMNGNEGTNVSSAFSHVRNWFRQCEVLVPLSDVSSPGEEQTEVHS
jgi:hypothetical protein